MASFNSTLNELINDMTARDFIEGVGPAIFPEEEEPMLGNRLFPPLPKRHELDFQYIKGATNQPSIAQIHAPNSVVDTINRDAVELQAGKLFKLGSRMEMDETLIRNVLTPRTDAEIQGIIDVLYNDVANTQYSVMQRIEKMRIDVLTRGKIYFTDEGGGGILPDHMALVDYGMPSENQLFLPGDLPWGGFLTDTTDWLMPLQEFILDWNYRKGRRIRRIIISPRVFNLLMRNENTKKYLFGAFLTAGITATSPGAIPTLGGLNAMMQGAELPIFEVYGRMYNIDASDERRAVKKRQEYYFPDNMMVMVPEGPLGNTLYGYTVEEMEIMDSVRYSETQGIITRVHNQVSPIARYTESIAYAAPSFQYGEFVVQMEVLPAITRLGAPITGFSAASERIATPQASSRAANTANAAKNEPTNAKTESDK